MASTATVDLSDDAATSLGSASPLSNEPEPEETLPKTTKPPRKPRAKKDPVAQREAYLARRREIKARARSRQKETASTLNEQYALLQKQLTAALATYKGTTRVRLEQHLSHDHRVRQLWDEYVDALDLSQAITQENQQLVDRIDEFVMFECRLLLAESEYDQEQVSTQQDDAKKWRDAHSLLHRRGYWTQFMDEHDAPFYYECYREAECNKIIRHNYAIMQQDIKEATAQQWTMSGGCFGWKGYGNIDKTDAALVRFQFRKRLRRSSSSQLMDEMTRETSRIFHSSKLYARLYGMRMESQVMQRVDDHTTVILQSLSDAYRVLSLRSFMLFSCVGEQLHDGRRAMTILNAVIPPREQDVVVPFGDPHRMLLYMTDCLIYMRMEQVDDEQLDVIYGGHAHCVSPDLAKVCVIESVSSFFRWVQQVIPERLVAFN